MKNYEEIARGLHRGGNNCSTSVHNAFIDHINIGEDYPAPRSIDGKCGALLTGIDILKKTGNEDKIERFEKEFIKKFGYSKCVELMTHERRCNDYVGEISKMIEETALQ